MGVVAVEGLGDVEYPGDTLTPEFAAKIKAALVAKRAAAPEEGQPAPAEPQRKIDLTPLATAGDEAIDNAASGLPEWAQPAARAAMKTPRDLAFKGVQLAAMPFVAAKNLTNAMTFPIDIYDRYMKTNHGRDIRRAIPQVEAGTAADVGGDLLSLGAGMGGLGVAGRAVGIPETVGKMGSAARRIVGGAAVGTAMTEPDRPTIIGGLVGNIQTEPEQPALDNRARHFVDQAALGGALETTMAVAPPLARAGRDFFQGFTKKGTERRTAEALQTTAGGAERSAQTADELEAGLAARAQETAPISDTVAGPRAPAVPGVQPTTAELTPGNAGVQGLEKKYLQTGGRGEGETAPATLLAERNAENLAAARAARDTVALAADVEATAPMGAAARREADALAESRGSATGTAERNYADQVAQRERDLVRRGEISQREAAMVEGEYQDMLNDLGGVRQQGDASARIAPIVDAEFVRRRAEKNQLYDALRTGEPVDPTRITQTLDRVLGAASEPGGAAQALASSPSVARLRALVQPNADLAAVDAEALLMARRAVGSRGAANDADLQALALRLRPVAAERLGVDLNAAAGPQLTTTDLIDLAPRLSAEIKAAQGRAATQNIDGDVVRHLRDIRRAISIYNEGDAQALLGRAAPETRDAARRAVQAYQQYSDLFKRGPGKDIAANRQTSNSVEPTAVVPTYLGRGDVLASRERAQQLITTLRGAPDAATRAQGETALRDWLVGELGRRTVRGQPLAAADIRKFQGDWSELINQMPPAVQEELGMLARDLPEASARATTARAAANARQPAVTEAFPQLREMRARIDQMAAPSAEEAALNALGDRLGADPVKVFREGLGAPRPLGDDGIGPLLKLARTDADRAALKVMASTHLRDIMGKDLGGAAALLADPSKRAALAKIFTPSELARLDAVNKYAAGREATKGAPSTGTFATLRAPGANFVSGLRDFLLGHGKAGRMASLLKDVFSGGGGKAGAERALMAVLTDPEVALKALRLNLADEGAVLKFLDAYAAQPVPGVTSVVGSAIREGKEDGGR